MKNIFSRGWYQRLINNNLFLKIISTVVAITIWFIVAITISEDMTTTVQDVTIDIPIASSALAGEGYEVIEGRDQTVSVTVRGPRLQISSLTAEDFTAYVSLTSVVGAGTVPLDVSVSLSQSNSNIQIDSYEPREINVRFDKVIEKTFTVEARADGITAEKDFIRGTPTGSPEILTLRGPETDIAKIDKVVYVSDHVESFSESDEVEGMIQYYDSEGRQLELPYVTTDKENVYISVPILQEVTLPLEFDYVNVPSGFDTGQLAPKLSVDKIKVGIPSSSTSASLSIGTIDFREIEPGKTFTFDINLPAGWANMENLKTVTVSFDLGEYATTTMQVTQEQMTFSNKPADIKQVNLVTSSIKDIKVVGPASEVELITASDVVVKVDLVNFTATSSGNYVVGVSLDVPGYVNTWVVGKYSIVINVTV